MGAVLGFPGDCSGSRAHVLDVRGCVGSEHLTQTARGKMMLEEISFVPVVSVRENEDTNEGQGQFTWPLSAALLHPEG